MQNFLNKVGKTAGAAVNKAGNKANELIEVSKLKAKISTEKQDIETLKQDIGDYCYYLFKDGKIEDETIAGHCERIKICEAMIAELEKQIDDVREEYRGGSSVDLNSEDEADDHSDASEDEDKAQ